MSGGLTREHIRESNLIEGIDDPAADATSEQAWIELSAARVLDLETVLACHWGVTADQLGQHAGVLRTVGVRVGGRVCPPPEQVPGLLADWLRDMHTWSERDPRAMHVRFERMHPFIDGNGRVGRLLFWLHQMWLGQPPILLRAAERQAYYRWFWDEAEWAAHFAQFAALLKGGDPWLILASSTWVTFCP